MKKRIFLVTLLILIVLFSSGCGRRIRERMAEQQESGSTQDDDQSRSIRLLPILFRDDFQDGNTNGWGISSGWFVNQDGDSYTFNPSGAGGAWVPGGIEWEDYIFRSAVRLDQGAISLMLRWTPFSRYILHYNTSGLYLLKENMDGNITTLASAPPPQIGITHYFAMGVEAGRILVYVNRLPMLDYLDESPLSAGTIGMGSLADTAASIDNVLVTRLVRSLPEIDPVAALPAPPLDTQSIEQVPVNLPPQSSESAPIPEENTSVPTELEISFTVEGSDSANISAGECATLEWNVHNAMEVYLDSGSVNANGFEDVCPEQNIVYTLEAVGFDGSSTERTVSLSIGEIAEVEQEQGIDISAVNIQVPAETNHGEAVSVSITVQNTGNIAAGAFNVLFHPDGSDIVGCSWDIFDLGPGESQTINCDYIGYPQAGQIGWLIVLDSENEVNESAEDNNSVSGSIQVNPLVDEPELEAPLAPVNCMVSLIESTSVIISWEYPFDPLPQGFRIYQAGVSLEAELDNTWRDTSIGNLDPGVEYQFDVRAFNGNLESPAGACELFVTTSNE